VVVKTSFSRSPTRSGKALREPPLGDDAGVLGIPLKLPRRNVVAAGVGGDIAQRVFARDVFSILTNDDAKLALVVGLVVLADFGDHHICTVVQDRCVGLEEDERKRRRLSAGLLDYFDVRSILE